MARRTGDEVVGERHHRLTITNVLGSDGSGKVLVRTVCQCGAEVTVRYSNLRSGNTKSCGCHSKEVSGTRFFKHGLSGDDRFQVWVDMHKRCSNASHPSQDNYGGRGISVCSEWHGDPGQFYSDMGPRPEGFTLERKENDGPYAAWNCIWAPMLAQQNNKRSNLRITWLGETKTAAQWARFWGIGKQTLLGRYHSGWPLRQVFGLDPRRDELLPALSLTS